MINKNAPACGGGKMRKKLIAGNWKMNKDVEESIKPVSYTHLDVYKRQEENPQKPLSDQKITERLNEQGINISRRTVAKYRDEMRIPSSSMRRRY